MRSNISSPAFPAISWCAAAPSSALRSSRSSDNGRGIDPKDHQRIFDLFRRAGTQDKPGQGIGLAHVRALVRRLGGTMSVASELHHGSTFTITLPINWNISNRNKRQMSNPVTIIMIEDDEGHARLIERNIRRSGVNNEIIPFTNGTEALNYLFGKDGTGLDHKGNALLILLDLNLPDTSGIDILKRVKDNKYLKTTPVVVLTTTDDSHEIKRCYELGCNVYITKPVNYESFANAIRQLGLFFSVIQVPPSRHMTNATPTLLYIDDDAALARLVDRGLTRLGFKVVHAADGQQGLDRLAQGGIDAIALDQYMPGLDGLETLEQILAIPGAPPVVFVTASQDSAIAVTALKAGAADYLVKDVQGDFIPLLQVAVTGALRQAAIQKARDEAEAEVHASRDRYAALAAEREVLLREVNHRVGNSLQIIASLLHLQANSASQDDVKAALTNAMGRVAAVAQVHRRLYTSHDLKSVLLNQYLEALLEDLRRSAEGNRMSRLTLKAEPIEIDPDRAVAIGIIVNELVMNAVKYAYPDGAGPIHVELKATATISCSRSPTTASASTSRPTRAPPAWDSASSRRWRPSSKPASSAIPPIAAPGSCCNFAASAPMRRNLRAPPRVDRYPISCNHGSTITSRPAK